jgi:spermidine synthase
MTVARPRPAPPVAAILAVFVLSGAAGLVYEIVWSRQLVLVFGNTTQAVSAILTGFFGGMAIGAAVGGRVADRVRSPLRLYGILELILVAVVLVTPISFGLIREAYRGIYPSLEGSPPLLALVRLGLAVLALAPATVLMGATFPSLTRYLARTSALSRAFGRLYAANTIGAIAGTLAAGLALIELLGLSGALAVGATCSAIAGVTALWLARGGRGEETLPEGAGASEPAATGRREGGPPDTRQADHRTRLVRAGLVPRPRLALVIAFISGLTSLAYQVTWTRLLASGTGNTTYVFTVILATFLAGIAIGALIFGLIRSRLGDPLRLLAASQVVVAGLVLLGLVLVLGRPEVLDPGKPIATLKALFGSALLVVLPVTIVLGIAFPTASILLRDEAGSAGGESGSLLAVNTVGAIVGSLVVPFVLMPTIGSPAIIVVLAIGNLALGLGLAVMARPKALPALAIGAMVVVLVGTLVLRPEVVAQPNEAYIRSQGGTIFASTEDEIASVQAGQIRPTPELWVAGTSMTLLTVDAKLMPVLPLIARPASSRALVVAFGMGTAFRAALIAGLRTDAVELVPSVPDMFGYYYDDAADVLADPAGRVIITDGRNHLELTPEHFDIVVTDPPPPIESSGASVISSEEYYEAGKAHLTPGGIMMQWVPYGAPESEFKEHIRTFAAVYPHVAVIKGAGGYGAYMLGSEQPMAFGPDAIREVLARPGILADISSAYDSPASSVDAWIAVIERQLWLEGDAVTAYAGDGPLITDDHPRPEYFLLRRLANGTANE